MPLHPPPKVSAQVSEQTRVGSQVQGPQFIGNDISRNFGLMMSVWPSG